MCKSIKNIPVIAFLLLFNSMILESQNETIDHCFVKMDGGHYKRGSEIGNADERPIRRIYLNAFYISKYEISNQQYCHFLNQCSISFDSLSMYIDLQERTDNGETGIFYDSTTFQVLKKNENLPVTYVSWFGAKAYCDFYGYRLPTEAEWEYAAKGGRRSLVGKLFSRVFIYSGGDVPDSVAWYRGNSDGKPHPIGIKQPNASGIYDMSGNVDEWCNDWYLSNYYTISENENPLGPAMAQFKVIRGGSWYNNEDKLTVTNRRATNPENKKSTIGFRVVLDINN
jgi:formylglycine-generating enzyme required for sulfatase activity